MKFLQFVHADLAESTDDFGDEFVRRLQDGVRQVKASREMEKRFMVLEEMLRKERREGFQAGISTSILLLLTMKYREPSEHLKNLITSQDNADILQNWLLSVNRTTSLEDFLREIGTTER